MPTKTFPTLDYSQRGHSNWLDALDNACREWGCFQVCNHSLDEALCTNILSEMEQFFALPPEDKQALERSADNPWGFYDRELTKNVRDWKQIFDVGPTATQGPFGGALTPWPQQLATFRSTVEAYYAASQSLALSLLGDIGECLGVQRGLLEADFGEDHSSFLRLNYYPTCTEPERHLGISPHTDAGALTVLMTDGQTGLQFQRGGDWYTVQPVPDALTINIGDIVQVWSNDRYQAPLHRVLASDAYSRYSAPFFLNPNYNAVYAPLSTALEGAAPLYRPINWGEFRAGRAAGDYSDIGAEIQISDFRRCT